MVQNDLELLILLPQPPKCCVYRCEAQCSAVCEILIGETEDEFALQNKSYLNTGIHCCDKHINVP
jgi:hypothetical protein